MSISEMFCLEKMLEKEARRQETPEETQKTRVVEIKASNGRPNDENKSTSSLIMMMLVRLILFVYH